MVRRFVGILFIPVLALAVAPASALTRTVAVQATDPSANTPAGVIYSIPLDSARQDAAPHAGAVLGGGPGGAGGGSSTGGSSGSGAAPGTGSGATGSGASASGATVSPASGASGTGSGAPGVSRSSASAGGATLVPGGQPGSLVHSANGFGSSSNVPGLGTNPVASLGALQGNAGSAPTLAIVLSLILIVVGAYVGRRAWRSSGGADSGGAGRIKGLLGRGPPTD